MELFILHKSFAQKKMTNKSISKFLSLVLRHQPELIGLTMDEHGWVNVADLLSRLRENGKDVSLDRLREIVHTNPKQRFKLDEQHNRIRANQGHSISVNVQLAQKVPPNKLYHGTAAKFLTSIMEQGLRKMNRQHVHLSSHYTTAKDVGSRHGKPVVIAVDCAGMIEAGATFYLSENGVWLTDYVGPEYLFIEE